VNKNTLKHVLHLCFFNHHWASNNDMTCENSCSSRPLYTICT